MSSETASRAKNSNMSEKQKKLLVEYMKKNPNLLSGKFKNTFTKVDAQNKWKEIAALLNSIPGSIKEWKAWRTSWQHLKSRTKVKESNNKKSARKTGGGSYEGDVITTTEEDVLSILTNVSVEGYDNEESVAHFIDPLTFEVSEDMVVEEASEESRTDDIAQIMEEPLDLNPVESDWEHPNSSSYEVLKNVFTMPEGDPKPKEGSGNSSGGKVAIKNLPKKTLNLINAATAATSFKNNLDKKITIKENYYQRKLEIMEETLVLRRKKVAALENISKALENFHNDIN